ncbi:MAG: ATP-dependent helicase HrpB [Rhodobiaceae bacterium]|nr:ATP-dependent helicase HrpB [Rhodobiaceae bacterium]MCC0049151.1 ATP-dependent helicase HrpB [Rhodobiaceae bacterium]
MGEEKNLLRGVTSLDLPVVQVLNEVRGAVAGAPAAILVAPPGAGKTTVVPLVLADEPWAQPKAKIIVLEPRRIATRAAASRMAALTGTKLGGIVGLRARLDTRVSAQTRIEVVTEGVFTGMILDDPSLEGIAAVVFDEFHERSLDADLALALVRDSQAALRPDLKIIVMSATLETEKLSAALDDPPVIRAEGRMFPVETIHLGRPQQGSDIARAVAGTVLTALDRHDGSVLAFLPGAGEIRRAAMFIEEKLKPGAGVTVHQLFGAMDRAAQDAAIAPAPSGQRKVVLATPIAETSITIDGVSVVVDSGLMRVPRFDPRRGLTRLETVRITRANAEQRRGRAGRTAPGVCYRLWADAENLGMAAHPAPEITNADLAGLRLSLGVWGARRVGDLEWIDAPPEAAWRLAEETLTAIGALDDDGQLTPLGRRMSGFGLPPRLAAMLCGASDERDVRLAAQIAAVLSEDAGGRDTDLRTRFAQAKRTKATMELAGRFAGLAGVKSDGPVASADHAGRLLALAYPERVARRRAGRDGVYQTVAGQGAKLPEHDGLAKADWLVIADAQGSGADLTIRLAAGIAEADVRDLFEDRIVSETQVRFDAERGSVRGETVARLGAIALSRKTDAGVDPDAITAALIEGIRQEGLTCLPFSEAAHSLRQRVAYARTQDAGGGWPDLSDGALIASLDEWLGPFMAGKTALPQITASDVSNGLALLLPGDLKRRIEDLLPERFETPAGSSAAIDYSAEGGPVAEVRVQALFGLDRHPAILNGRVPLRLSLLSPAGRPIQVTADLPAFWYGSWADVRAEMRGRYPKHPWPEDPANAEATLRAKPRK